LETHNKKYSWNIYKLLARKMLIEKYNYTKKTLPCFSNKAANLLTDNLKTDLEAYQ